MKKILSILLLCCAVLIFKAQNVGINTAKPNDKSILDIKSTVGVLLPRLTTAQRNSIQTSPEIDGLLIYNTDEKCFNFYRASQASWERLCGQVTNQKVATIKHK